MLARPDIYDWDSAKGCDFQPGVVVRFGSQAGIVDVLFCFSCNEISILRDGKRVGGEDIDRARGRLLALLKPLFPKDDALQALVEAP